MDEYCEWEIRVEVSKHRPGKSRALKSMVIKFTNYAALCKTEDSLLSLLEHFQSFGSPLKPDSADGSRNG